MKSFFLSLIGLFSFTLLSGQVIISEFSAANYSLGVAGDNEDFVEFFNLGPTEVDLGGYFLSDNPDNPDMFEIPNGTTIASGGYLIIMCSNEGEVPEMLYTGGYLNTNFKVTQTIGLSAPACVPLLLPRAAAAAPPPQARPPTASAERPAADLPTVRRR